MKDIKCKCDHLRSEHNKKFLHRKSCNICECEKYLRFNRPDKMDKFFLIYQIVVTGLLLYTIQVFYESINGKTGAELQATGLNVANLLIVLYAGFIGLAALNQLGFVSDYLRMKNRKNLVK